MPFAFSPFVFEYGKGGIIEGWQLAASKLTKGAKATLFIPSTLAYGSKPVGDKIGPNEILIFEIKIVDVR